MKLASKAHDSENLGVYNTLKFRLPAKWYNSFKYQETEDARFETDNS